MSKVADTNGRYVYTFRSWVPTYAFWLGVVQLVGLNLLGIAWLVWSKRMQVVRGYQPKWMFRFHWFLTGFHVLVLALALIVGVMNPEHTGSVRVYGAKVGEANIWWTIPILVALTALYAVGLRGIRRERQNSVR